MRILPAYVAAAFVAVCFGSFAVPRVSAANTFEVGAWVPYWQETAGTQDAIAHLSSLTTVFPFGYTVNPDGSLHDAMGIDGAPWKTLIADAKKKGARVVPTVTWNDGENIQKILSNTQTRIGQENAIAALVKNNDFDGIDIDYESKLAETKPYFSLFLKGLYMRLGNKFLYCTIEARTPLDARYTTVPTTTPAYANDYSALNQYCDRVQIMAYDQGTVDVALDAAANGKPYIPVADPHWVQKVIALAAQTISKNKIILGIPTYGYEYAVTPSGAQGLNYVVQWAFNPEYAIELAGKLGISPVRNSAGELQFTYVPTTTPNYTAPALAAGPALSNNSQAYNILSWSDALSVEDKVLLAKQLGLRGVSIFKADGGEDQRIWTVFASY